MNSDAPETPAWRRARVLQFLGLATGAAVLLRLAAFDWPAPAPGFHGHGYCYLRQPSLVAAHAGADILIATSYFAISISLVYLVRRTRQGLPFSWIFVAFGGFIVACGATHLMEVWTLWTPVFWLSADVKLITAAASVGTAVALPPLIPKVLHLAEAARISDQRRLELEAAKRELEDRVRDRTAALRSLLEREQQLRAQAEAANRAKQDFLATVSHELRTPLNAILGWSEMLQEPELAGARLEQGLKTIARNARAQAQVIDDLLDMARITAGTLSLALDDCEIVSVVSAAVDSVAPSAATKGVSLRWHRPASGFVIKADPVRVQQIMWNLLSNAIKFTPAGGSIDVRVSLDRDHVQIEVRDTGVGITPEFQERVFDRFSQADSSFSRQHGGLGLGLAIVRHLAELHDGRVVAHSDGPGRGATFRVFLPTRAGDVPAAVPDARPAGDSVRLANRSILAIDDEADSLDLLVTILEHAGGIASTATSVPQAIDLLAVQRFDAIVCDIGMPQADGYAFMRRLNALGDATRRPPVIALTGYASETDRQKVLAAGFAAYLAKPVVPSELVQVIDALLRRD